MSGMVMSMQQDRYVPKHYRATEGWWRTKINRVRLKGATLLQKLDDFVYRLGGNTRLKLAATIGAVGIVIGLTALAMAYALLLLIGL